MSNRSLLLSVSVNQIFRNDILKRVIQVDDNWVKVIPVPETISLPPFLGELSQGKQKAQWKREQNRGRK